MIDHLRYTMRAMQQFSRTQEVTANNLANLNTPGFKKDKLFQRGLDEAMYGDMARGVEQYTKVNLEVGEMEPTQGTFDFAINGDGFFEVEANGNKFLTRNGHFHIDNSGVLRNEKGDAVQGMSGSITIPDSLLMGRLEQQEQKIEVSKDGMIRINDTPVDQIKLVRIKDDSTLERMTNSYLVVKDPNATEIDYKSQVSQGYLEKGNVNTLEEMLNMTQNMRLFESSQRNMRTTDEIISEVTTRLGRY